MSILVILRTYIALIASIAIGILKIIVASTIKAQIIGTGARILSGKVNIYAKISALQRCGMSQGLLIALTSKKTASVIAKIALNI